MISILLDKDIKFNNIKEIHKRMEELSPNLKKLLLNFKHNNNLINFQKLKGINNQTVINSFPFKSFISDYYQLTAIERASKVMHQCSITFCKNNNNFIK